MKNQITQHANLIKLKSKFKAKFSILALVAVIALAGTACKKYPDGPEFSLHTKTERVAQNWKVGQALDSSRDVTTNYNKYYLDLTKSGGATLTAQYTFAGTVYDYSTGGSWAFVNDKANISFNFSNNNASGVYVILKLEQDEMWLKQDAGSLELHFVPQ
jgi:hypothetical protein